MNLWGISSLLSLYSNNICQIIDEMLTFAPKGGLENISVKLRTISLSYGDKDGSDAKYMHVSSDILL